VHARGQVARFSTGRALDATRVPHALNAHLPEDVVVIGAEPAAAAWHPIGAATGKRYRYTFRVAEFDDPFVGRYVHRIPSPLDLDAMRRAASHLRGRRDFAPFQRSGSPREKTVRTLARLDVVSEGEYIHLDFVGDGFLYGMARNLAGTLCRVGRRELDPDVLPSALDALDPRVAGPCLPAQGLCLMQVYYGADA
ncbi:MAG: tRNA pseudouridine synthase A, partial [Planctomycetota bacterium]